jgi:hypothetical protein
MQSLSLDEISNKEGGGDETALALEIMCNQVETEEAKEKSKQEKKLIGISLDLKLARIRNEKQRIREAKIIESMTMEDQLRERNTGLIL